jgi:hypothetical protein
MKSALTSPLAGAHLAGIVEGYRGLITGKHDRAPVSSHLFWLFRRLKKCGPIRLIDLECELPAIGSVPRFANALLPDQPVVMTVHRGPFRAASCSALGTVPAKHEIHASERLLDPAVQSALADAEHHRNEDPDVPGTAADSAR